MNVLITGGAGFIGSHLAERLIEQGNTVRVYDNLSIGKSNIEHLLDNPCFDLIVGDLLDEDKTLLGVDIVKNKQIIANDVNENQLLLNIKNKNPKIIVTPIGGQGFIFGRGNQQISPKIIRLVGRENIIVISTKQKLRNLKGLRVDTGDTELDNQIIGYMRVVTDYREERVIHVT